MSGFERPYGAFRAKKGPSGVVKPRPSSGLPGFYLRTSVFLHARRNTTAALRAAALGAAALGMFAWSPWEPPVLVPLPTLHSQHSMGIA